MYTLSKKFIVICILTVITVVFLLFMLIFAIGKKEVTIETVPPEAQYKVGTSEGKTPGKIKLSSGKYSIEIKKGGYNIKKENFKVPYFKQKITLRYDLTKTELKKLKLPTKEEAQAMQKKYEADFPYASLLPLQESTYYISRPSNDGYMNIYILKAKEAEGKKGAQQWLTDHGADLNKLKINWVYSKNK